MAMTLHLLRTCSAHPGVGRVAAWLLLAAAAPVLLCAGTAILLAGPGEIIMRVPYLRRDGRLGYRSVFRTTLRFDPARHDARPNLFSPVGAVVRWLGLGRLPWLLDVGLGRATMRETTRLPYADSTARMKLPAKLRPHWIS